MESLRDALKYVQIGFTQLPDKLAFDDSLPSPMGRVAERSEVGRGFPRFLFPYRKTAPENLFRQPFGLLSFPIDANQELNP